MGRIQKVRMLKRIPRGPTKKYIQLHNHCKIEGKTKSLIKIIRYVEESKSVYDIREKTDLSFCNMDAHKVRKTICERVQLDATLRDRNL